MRTKYCGQLRSSHIGQKVTLCGWVHRYRNLGNFIFIDMRDREGIVQIVFSQYYMNTLKQASELRNEFCIQIRGIVCAREEKNINMKMVTGTIEVLANELTIINYSVPLPIDFNQINKEEVRLKYRYLDLRRLEMIQRLKTRAKVTSFVHYFMDKHGFLEIETPILTKATMEGARNYLIPSRIHQGKFYALPQSPQLFKQLLMISGFDRYYQIARCFRDENLRSDRQPEFTQIDIETSFMTKEKMREILEELIKELWKKVKNVNLSQFPVMTFSEVKRRFGSDKPDLRNPIELIDVADLLKNVEFANLSGPANSLNGRVIALCVPGGTNLSNKKIEDYSNFIKKYGAKNLIHIRANRYKKGFIDIDSFSKKKFLESETIKAILERTNAKDSDIIFICADHNKEIVTEAFGALRLKLGKDLHLIDETKWAPLWVVDFPLFEENEKGNLKSMHHPFTSPKNMTLDELKATPKKALANSYDIVINGYEVGSGSIRIHDSEMQKAVFEILGIMKKEQYERFGYLLDAMKFGTPPHAGLAFGLDRLTMLLTETNNIRDIIAFPKSTAATCLMTETPSFINYL